MEKFNETYIHPRIRKQINEYIKNYKYSYSGIYRTLVYFFEIKKSRNKDLDETIGIVPYVYKEAYNYYYTIWLANQKNEDKDIVSYKPKTQEIHIPTPARKIKKKKLFMFLDED